MSSTSRMLGALIAAQLTAVPAFAENNDFQLPAICADIDGGSPDAELVEFCNMLSEAIAETDNARTTDDKLQECVADNADTLEELRSLRAKYNGLVSRYNALVRKSQGQ